MAVLPEDQKLRSSNIGLKIFSVRISFPCTGRVEVGQAAEVHQHPPPLLLPGADCAAAPASGGGEESGRPAAG